VPGVLPSPAIPRGRPRLRPASPTGRGPGEPAGAVTTSSELWLAIHLPNYVIESLRRDAAASDLAAGQPPGAATTTTVVVDVEDGAKVICACDDAASAAGVVHGMALNSALALLPGLSVLAREIPRERALLEVVATCSGNFTPRVALEPPDGVLLEVRGSLGLFGGVRKLIARLRERLRTVGVEPRLAIAPTPLAALWFARTGEEVALRNRDGLANRLAPLPLVCTRWPAKTIESFATMGVRTLGDCLRLPRDGFARRFEPEMLRTLDRAVGRTPDPRAAFARRERYAARRDLEPEIFDTDRLVRAIAPLLEGLCEYLQGRGCAVDTLEFQFVHRDAPSTRVRLRFAEPAARAERMSGLLHELLARTALPEPVRVVRLRSGPLVEAREEAGDLFVRDRGGAAGAPQFIERLRARLGADAVHGLRLVSEHRPEAAWEAGDIPRFPVPLPKRAGEARPGKQRTSPVCSPEKENAPVSRPLWLLAEAQLLEGLEWPQYEGRLEIEDGPERIESGWWDGRDVRRDYYVARTATGVRLWVFRERRRRGDADGRTGRWFLHGVFG
jgi:protein ImuB